ncbi:MAG: C40 family peptidase [Oscillospiraceae bacterium]|nr:C40 family peptidase [Oscillospiraceae bacterium]
MKKIISIILIVALVAAFTVTASAKGTVFSDVDESAWYYKDVTALASAGIIGGYSDGTFRPNGTVTNGEALKLILLASGYTAQSKTDSHWASGYRDLAVMHGIMTSADIELDAPITRLDVANLAANALGLRTATIKSPFIDTDDNAATVLFENGIITGSETSAGIVFNGADSLKRSEISAIIYRIINTNFDAHTGSEQPDAVAAANDSMTHILVSCSGYLNIRSGPSTDTDIVGRIYAGRTAELVSDASGWYKVNYGSVSGYVSADYCTPVDYAVEEPDYSGLRLDIVEYAKKFAGVSYVYGGASPSGFDCSGFVMYVMKNFGYDLGHSARAQYSSGTPISKSELKPGDLVFFSNSSTTWIGHVGIYIGDGLFIHASSGSAYCVTISELSSSWYTSHYIDACRIIND